MSRIALLSEIVRNQIAAGEVIERPAAALKELLENAIDAGARNVRVDLEEGGARLVRVTDDGGGMPREDVALAFVAHATSKLRDLADLDHIASLGFRGEALASMGAVARCRIFSRESSAETGWRVENEGGALGATLEAGGSVGTIVEVRDLFFNVPARRHFLKQTSTELGRCLDVLQRTALAHGTLGLSATHDGKRILDVEAGMDARGRIRRLFGAELEAALVAVEARDADAHLYGFVAPPRFARADTARQMWFLNGRALRDKVLLRALKEGYRGFLFDTRQPVAFLHLAIDPGRVDVNVHPAKTEVRFRDERRLFGFIVNSVRTAVARTDMATPGERLVERALARTPTFPVSGGGLGSRSTVLFPPQRTREVPHVVDIGAAGTPGGVAGARAIAANYELPTASSDAVVCDAPGADFDAALGAGFDVGFDVGPSAAPGACLQIARTYIVRALADGFEIVDQHALHERITFETLLAEWKRGAVEKQRLLVPELVELSRAELALLEARFEDLDRVAIECSRMGETTLAVSGLPARLAHPRAEALVRDVLELLESAREITSERLIEDVLHRAACRASVMAGDELTGSEMTALLARGQALVSDQTCVHGRPTRVRFTLADLEKAFARR